MKEQHPHWASELSLAYQLFTALRNVALGVIIYKSDSTVARQLRIQDSVMYEKRRNTFMIVSSVLKLFVSDKRNIYLSRESYFILFYYIKYR